MADDEQYQEASPQTKINIATYFIMSSPTGEVHDVLKDVIALVNDPSVLTEERINAIMQDYNTQNMIAATTPDGHDALVTVYGQVDNSHFLDPLTGKVLKFDHKSQKFLGDTDQKQVLAPDVEAMRHAIHSAVRQYVDSVYQAKKATIAVYGTDDHKITVCISARNVRLSSFWSGGLRSVYSIDVSKPGPVEFKAHSTMNVHYFEDGNVQLHTNFDKVLKANVSDPASTTKSVVGAIEKFESDLHSNLEELYVNMHGVTFKALRRFLPISGVPMNWNSAVHSVAQEVSH